MPMRLSWASCGCRNEPAEETEADIMQRTLNEGIIGLQAVPGDEVLPSCQYMLRLLICISLTCASTACACCMACVAHG